MVASWLYLAGAVVGALFTLQARRPIRLPNLLAIPSFFAGWLTNELAFHHLVWQLVATVVWVWLGALEHWAGWVALALTVAQWVVLVATIREAMAAKGVVERAVQETTPEHLEFSGIFDDEQLSWARLVVPLPRHPEVRSEWHRVYARVGARDLKLDVHRHRDHDPASGDRRPVLVYVHGGGWVLGFRERNGLPLMYELASRGWVCVSADYRLSPLATWPDHVADVKRAIAWVREHADELGVDPSFVAVSGNSAGGHLSAVAALTGNDPRLQPGFEDADTSVQAAVPFYGVYDFLNRRGFREERWIEFPSRWILKCDPDEDPERWRTASPWDLVNEQAPPFLVVHGASDTMTPPGEAEAFVERLRAVSRAPVGLALLPGAQHAFDLFPSLRTARVVHGVVRFLEYAYSAHGEAHRRADPGAA